MLKPTCALWQGHVAPFLVALDKGYYQAEGLNVTVTGRRKEGAGEGKKKKWKG